MAENLNREEILAAELDVLRAMCTGTPEGTIWDKGMILLNGYSFQDVTHQLIFDVLQEINTDLPNIIRQQLPARLTNKGFPAVDFEKFLSPHALTATQAVARMETLRSLGGSTETPGAWAR